MARSVNSVATDLFTPLKSPVDDSPLLMYPRCERLSQIGLEWKPLGGYDLMGLITRCSPSTALCLQQGSTTENVRNVTSGRQLEREASP